MEINKLQCFKPNNNNDLTTAELIEKIYKGIDRNFFFNIMKGICDILGDKFLYKVDQVNDVLIDLYFNDGKCMIFFVDFFPAKISITTEVVTMGIKKQKVSSKIKINSKFNKEEFNIFYKIFSFLFLDLLEIKEPKVIDEITN
jgi:hypothetical protein